MENNFGESKVWNIEQCWNTSREGAWRNRDERYSSFIVEAAFLEYVQGLSSDFYFSNSIDRPAVKVQASGLPSQIFITNLMWN